MQRYNLRIDGQISPNTFSFQELVDQGLFDLNDMKGFEVKATSETYYKSFENYPFPERQRGGDSSSDYYIDEYGQMHRKSVKSSSNSSSSSTTPTRNHSTTSNSKPTNSSSSNSNINSNKSSSSTSSSDNGFVALDWFCAIAGALLMIVLVDNNIFVSIGGAILGLTASAILKEIFD